MTTPLEFDRTLLIEGLGECLRVPGLAILATWEHEALAAGVATHVFGRFTGQTTASDSRLRWGLARQQGYWLAEQ